MSRPKRLALFCRAGGGQQWAILGGEREKYYAEKDACRSRQQEASSCLDSQARTGVGFLHKTLLRLAVVYNLPPCTPFVFVDRLSGFGACRVVGKYPVFGRGLCC
jgi:hypothetical protein